MGHRVCPLAVFINRSVIVNQKPKIDVTNAVLIIVQLIAVVVVVLDMIVWRP